MSASPNLTLPYIATAQAQKHVTHNEAIRALDALVQVAVLDRDLATPPSAPADGDRYLIANAPTGAWAGKSGLLAAFQDGAWMFYSPRPGWLVWVIDEAVLLARATNAWVLAGGAAASPAPMPNLLLNGHFLVNQRNFTGGALAAGAYGHDRWKADTGGANYTVSGETVTLTSGTLIQIIEPQIAARTSLAGQSLTLSAEAVSADLSIALGAQTGTLIAGSGRRSLTLTLGAGETGNISLKVAKTTAGTVTMARLKLELGTSSTAWSPVALEQELATCRRYFQILGRAGQPRYFMPGFYLDGGQFSFIIPFEQTMRATPTMAFSGTANTDYGIIYQGGVVPGFAFGSQNLSTQSGIVYALKAAHGLPASPSVNFFVGAAGGIHLAAEL